MAAGKLVDRAKKADALSVRSAALSSNIMRWEASISYSPVARRVLS